jgi:outer membrane lipoprotein-sorting protein
MKTIYLLLFALLPLAPARASDTAAIDPEKMIDALRAQMNRLHSIRAEYTIDSQYGPQRRRVTSKLSYIRSRDKYNILESAARPDAPTVQIRYVHDGIQLKQYVFDPNARVPRQAAVYESRLHADFANHNDLLRFAHFLLARNYDRLDPNNRTLRYLGTEVVDARPCSKVLMITPYLPGHNAFNYHWIDRADSHCILRKVSCIIDDDPNSLLYARTYSYNANDPYPLPREIYYERYDIDAQGNRSLYYIKRITVESLQVNVPIDPAEFNFTFPEGTLVNVSPVILDPEKSPEPNRPETREPATLPGLDQNEPADLTAEFQIPPTPTPILLPVTFEGREYLFLLDTGSTGTVFDVSLRDRLGPPKKLIRAQTAGNPVVTQLFDAPDARIGPFSLRDAGLVAVANLKMPFDASPA